MGWLKKVFRIARLTLRTLLGLFAVLVFAGIVYGINERGCRPEATYTDPSPERPVVLPRDHAAHDDYKTEWWYYTGHLTGENGRDYGFELVFFRSRTENVWYGPIPVWWLSYPHAQFAHFAITDKSRGMFAWDEKTLNHKANSGASNVKLRVWIQDWEVNRKGEVHLLRASTDGYAIDLKATPVKPAVLHGKGGYHNKGSFGMVSNYISFTRMAVTGTLRDGDADIPVTGQAWMDHEFASGVPPESFAGWDWFSLQLDNQYEIMLYEIRLKDGSYDPQTTGTLVLPDGTWREIPTGDYELKTLQTWTSPHSGATYPARWDLKLIDPSLSLTITPATADQELAPKGTLTTYWEGAVDVEGHIDDAPNAVVPVTGKGYVELTGYDKPVDRF